MALDALTFGQVGGFIAAEGHFSQTARRFAVRVAVGAEDAAVVLAVAEKTGVGSVLRYAPRADGYEGEARWQVQALRELHDAIVPLCDEFLLPSNKRRQYLVWREQLMRHLHSRHRTWLHGERICSIPGCAVEVRAKGLCRQHYYVEFGG